MRTLAGSLTSLEVGSAVAFVLVAAALELIVEHELKRRLPANRAFHWSWDHVLAPVLRASVMVGFVVLAYPASYGLRDAPSFSILLAGEETRLVHLTNTIFVCSLLLPLLPIFDRRAGTVLLIQGLVATAMLFGWYAAYIGAHSAGPWPGFAAATIIAGLAFVAHKLTLWLGPPLGQLLDDALHTTGFDAITPAVLTLVLQAPTVLVYGYTLGLQIAI